MATKQLKIKTGTLTRSKKELVMYEKEHEREQEKVKKMMADGADAADLKQAVLHLPSLLCLSFGNILTKISLVLPNYVLRCVRLTGN